MKYDTLFLFPTLLFSSILFFTATEASEKHTSITDLKNNENRRDKSLSLSNGYESNHLIHRIEKLRSDDEVLDCFGIGKTLAGSLDSYLKEDANGSKALKIQLHASTRNLLDRWTLNFGEELDLNTMDFDIRRRTIFVVHGFLADANEQWVEDMRRALVKWDDVNVFTVDWSDGSNTWNYYKAAVNTRTVGDQIATFIGQLIDASKQSNKVDPSSFGPLHLIGHSLGAHICGYAAQEILERKHKWTVKRITGLDPAQPCFKNTEKKLRLDEDDAAFVDIIHTNGRILTKLGLGLPFPIGHVDFYPNGGKVQPGCNLSSTSIWKYLPLPINTITKTICSHGRSYLYFIDTIMAAIEKMCTFWAHKWNLDFDEVDSILDEKCMDGKCIEMGINSERYFHNGTFFTVTGTSKPFCKIDNQAKEQLKEIIAEGDKESQK